MNEEEFKRIMQSQGLEMFALANRYQAPLNDDTTSLEDKLTVMRARCIEMIDMLKEHKRVWDFHSGHPDFKPKVQHAGVVLEGEMGGGAA